MKKFNLISILLATLLINACSSVPLATMMHFADAKPDDFFQVDPRGITIEVTINSAANFDPVVSVTLSATVEDEAGQRHYNFPLEKVSLAKLAAKESYFSSRPAMDIYILKLNAKAIKNLAMINLERKAGNKKRVGLSAGVNFSKDINLVDENTVLSIGLKLSEKGDFIMLIDNWRVLAEQ
ncbi:hypothetical protein [Colwellia sp. TT2012]|uniref:hypothetical protein n=1 Tax=Colwellia sp. TT2012 TaxID=1720342 RepID=UPI00070970A7|nr:hypothetical protein [Colwellia sp. TT2012]